MGNYFSTNLKFIREQKGLSQNKLANMIGVNQTTIAWWENDNRALNVPLPEILGKDLRLEHPNEEIKEFDFGDVKVTLSKNSKITDKDILEMNQFLMEEKIKGNLDE